MTNAGFFLLLCVCVYETSLRAACIGRPDAIMLPESIRRGHHSSSTRTHVCYLEQKQYDAEQVTTKS